MKWSKLLKRHGFPDVYQNGEEVDPFSMLCAANDGKPLATISYTTKTNHPDYGAVSCGLHVSIHCPQDERSLNLAAELCFRKTLELFNPAAAAVGSPQLPKLPE